MGSLLDSEYHKTVDCRIRRAAATGPEGLLDGHGIRPDAYAQAHRIRVEEDEPDKERGYYLHPKEFGQPEEKGVEHVHSSAVRAPGTAWSGN